MKLALLIHPTARLLSCVVLAAFTTALIEAAHSPPASPPLVEVRATDPVALEGASSGAFTLIRSGGTSAPLSVNYTLSGTASNGVDYVQLATSAIIPAGFAAADIVVTPLVNPVNTGNKKVILTLVTNANYTVRQHKSASVTIVDDSFDNQAPSVTLVAPTNGAVFAFPASITLRAEATDLDGSITKVSFYANDDFLGQATNSPFTLTWTDARPGRYALFARATDSLEKSTLSSPVHITVTNVLPTIKLLSPASGATFAAGANIKLDAEATASGGIAKVQFFVDHRFRGSVTNPPYSLMLSNAAPGKYIVTARAIDSVGTSATASARFTVTNSAPRVSITSPVEGATFAVRSPVTIVANATDSDGGIARVSFYANNRFIGRVSQPPYQVTWTNTAAGSYKLSAIATDAFGESSKSQTVAISVQ